MGRGGKLLGHLLSGGVGFAAGIALAPKTVEAGAPVAPKPADIFANFELKPTFYFDAPTEIGGILFTPATDNYAFGIAFELAPGVWLVKLGDGRTDGNRVAPFPPNKVSLVMDGVETPIVAEAVADGSMAVFQWIANGKITLAICQGLHNYTLGSLERRLVMADIDMNTGAITIRRIPQIVIDQIGAAMVYVQKSGTGPWVEQMWYDPIAEKEYYMAHHYTYVTDNPRGSEIIVVSMDGAEVIASGHFIETLVMEAPSGADPYDFWPGYIAGFWKPYGTNDVFHAMVYSGPNPYAQPPTTLPSTWHGISTIDGGATWFTNDDVVHNHGLTKSPQCRGASWIHVGSPPYWGNAGTVTDMDIATMKTFYVAYKYESPSVTVEP